MTEKEMIKELAHTLYCKQDKFDLSNPFEVAKAVIEEGYRKTQKEAVVLTMEELHELADDILQEYTNCYSEEDSGHLVWMLEEFVSKKLGVEVER